MNLSIRSHNIPAQSRFRGKCLEVIVLPRAFAEHFGTDGTPFATISIFSPTGSKKDFPIAQAQNCAAFLPLGFDDVELEWLSEPDFQASLVLFSEQMADEILDFICSLDKIELLLVHCDAGISRSAAVAAVVSAILNGEVGPFIEHFGPNTLVVKLLTEQAESRGFDIRSMFESYLAKREREWQLAKGAPAKSVTMRNCF